MGDKSGESAERLPLSPGKGLGSWRGDSGSSMFLEGCSVVAGFSGGRSESPHSWANAILASMVWGPHVEIQQPARSLWLLFLSEHSLAGSKNVPLQSGGQRVAIDML